MTTCTAVLIDRKNGTPADELDLSLSKAIPAAAVSTSCASLTETVPTPQNPKESRLPLSTGLYPFSFAIHLLFHSGLSSEFAMVQGCFVPTTNPEA